MRIALVGHYGSGNIGDEAQRQVIESALISWGHEVSVYGITTPVDADVRPVVCPWDVNSIASHDAVVVGGGMVLLNQPSPIWFINEWRTIEKPVFYFCIGAESLSDEAKEVYEDPLVRARMVMWRGHLSAECLPVDGQCFGTDLAYGLPATPSEGGEDICICSGVDSEWVRRLCKDVLPGQPIRFISLHNNHGSSPDYLLAESLAEEGIELTVDVPKTPLEAIEAMKSAKVVITGRRHGAVFAVLAGVKPIIIESHNRLKEIRYDLYQDVMVIDHNFTSEVLKGAIRLMECNHPIDPLLLRLRLCQSLDVLRFELGKIDV